jgi:hypothetical protein
MRIRTMFMWMNGPHPARGELSPDDVEDFQPTSVEAFVAAVDAVLSGATRTEEQRGAFRGPSWTWSRGDESIVLDDFETLDVDEDEVWGEVQVTVDCELPTLLGFWRALEERDVAAWAFFDDGPMLGPDAFVTHLQAAQDGPPS